MLELKNICYTVSTPETGEQTILKDISVTIPDGKLIVFTGPNGGGKTTLAKVIMGLVTPTSGQILWNGEDITALDITARAKRGISYGFQQPPRFKGITVRDLLTIASGDSKLSKDKCCRYLTQVGLCANDYLDREVASAARLPAGTRARGRGRRRTRACAGLCIASSPRAGRGR